MRCRACLFSESYGLPPVRKRIIYLDQPAISNMMFALNPATRAHREGRVDSFWLALFERLDTLSKLQLIVCPESEIHEQESMAHPHFTGLRRVYELLSHGVSFYDTETIRRFQVQIHASNWLDGRPAEPPMLPRSRIFHGYPDSWTDILQITARSQVTEDDLARLRESRERTSTAITRLFGQWRTETSGTFDVWFERECASYGRAVIDVCDKHLRRQTLLDSRQVELSAEDLSTPTYVVLFHGIMSDFRETGLGATEAFSRAREYLLSPWLRVVPALRIYGMLWAAIVRKAAIGGRKHPPTRGALKDTQAISALLPYCDAMFVDNEMRGYLREEPLATELEYPARIFSQSNREEFLAYLDHIRENVSAGHLDLVRRVYGDNRLRPFTTIFKDSHV